MRLAAPVAFPPAGDCILSTVGVSLNVWFLTADMRGVEVRPCSPEGTS